MKRLLLILATTFTISTLSAQSFQEIAQREFEQFKQQTTAEFDNFRQKANAAYAEFLKHAWR